MKQIPRGSTHINPLICKNSCQYVKIGCDGKYFFRENGQWVNVNNCIISDMNYLIKI